MKRIRLAAALLVVAAGIHAATVVDRVALVVGKTVFTQSEVDDEARLTEIESGKALDLSAAQRKAAAERLVDQELLRQEMQVTAFPSPPASDGDALVRQFRQKHYPTLALYHAALTRYGVTEDQLKLHLLWEVTVIRFTDQRFRAIPADPDAPQADRAQGGAQPAPDTVDKEMETWLKQQRTGTRIVFKPEAFQ